MQCVEAPHREDEDKYGKIGNKQENKWLLMKLKHVPLNYLQTGVKLS